jgi:hypothetical protein
MIAIGSTMVASIIRQRDNASSGAPADPDDGATCPTATAGGPQTWNARPCQRDTHRTIKELHFSRPSRTATHAVGCLSLTRKLM